MIKNIDSSYRYNLCNIRLKYAYYIYRNKRLNYMDRKKLFRDIFRMWHKTPN